MGLGDAMIQGKGVFAMKEMSWRRGKVDLHQVRYMTNLRIEGKRQREEQQGLRKGKEKGWEGRGMSDRQIRGGLV